MSPNERDEKDIPFEERKTRELPQINPEYIAPIREDTRKVLEKPADNQNTGESNE